MIVVPPPEWSDYLAALLRRLWSRIWPHVCFLIVILGFAAGLCAEDATFAVYRPTRIIDVPAWILRGIASVETGSTYDGDRIIYRDRRDGAAQEVGAFQIRRSALRDIGLSAHRAEIRTDPQFAEFAAVLFLRRLYRATGSWRDAVIAYHVGLDGDPVDGLTYYHRVLAAGVRDF